MEGCASFRLAIFETTASWTLALLCSETLSYSVKNFPENPAEAAAWRMVDLYCLRIFDQSNRSRKLRIFESGCQARHHPGVGDTRRQFENFLSQMIDAAQVTASAGNENSFADVINERFFFELA